MRLLTDADRSYILTQLTLAPDSVLANAMLEFNAIRDKIVAVRKIAETPPAATTETFTEGIAKYEQELIEKNAPRENVSPGPSAIGKIGSTTKEELLRILSQGNQPPAKFSEHLKLLWSRGEVKYDGKEYYL